MATQRAISTISYNSEAFLLEKLESWYKAHIIQAYQYIKHKGEDGGKDHIHLRLEPNKRVDPMDLSEELKEWTGPDGKPLTVPLGCRPWHYSEEADWVLYVVHDETYLRLKYGAGYTESGEKLPYDYHDIVVSYAYDLEDTWMRARATLKRSSSGIIASVRSGEKPIDLIAGGANAFLVNAVMTSLNNSDYSKLLQRFQELEKNYFELQDAVEKAGLAVVCDDNGKVFIEARSRVDKYESVPNWQKSDIFD